MIYNDLIGMLTCSSNVANLILIRLLVQPKEDLVKGDWFGGALLTD